MISIILTATFMCNIISTWITVLISISTELINYIFYSFVSLIQTKTHAAIPEKQLNIIFMFAKKKYPVEINIS